LAPVDEANDPRVGTAVDAYRIRRLIGGGAMGRVYDAEHTVLGSYVALKLIFPECAPNREAVRRFQNEAKSAGLLEHPNVVVVTDVGMTSDESPYVVMELLQGRDCGQLLESRGSLEIERACNIVHQACLGLSVAHQAGIVHRDIKPQNLFVTQASDGSDLVKVLDFGIAKLRVPAANLAVTAGVTVGTFYYLAPEQIRDAGKVDGRSDVWALGAVLYELLTGRRPFDGSDAASIAHQIAFETPDAPNELRPGLPAELISALDLALEKDPEKRFGHVLALADAIAAFTGRPVIRRSRLASSQRPPSPTPVDASYDTGASNGHTNAPISRNVAATRERAQRVYSLLILAALFGFAGGWLARKVVTHTGNIVESATALPVAQAPRLSLADDSQLPAVSATLAAPNPPAAPNDSIGPAGFATAITSATAPVKAVRQATVAPVRLVQASVDAGAPHAMVRLPSSDAPSTALAMPRELGVSRSAARASAHATPPAERVSEQPKAEERSSGRDDADSPL
jgi:serine/threonine-protein kinase